MLIEQVMENICKKVKKNNFWGSSEAKYLFTYRSHSCCCRRCCCCRRRCRRCCCRRCRRCRRRCRRCCRRRRCCCRCPWCCCSRCRRCPWCCCSCCCSCCCRCCCSTSCRCCCSSCCCCSCSCCYSRSNCNSIASRRTWTAWIIMRVIGITISSSITSGTIFMRVVGSTIRSSITTWTGGYNNCRTVAGPICLDFIYSKWFTWFVNYATKQIWMLGFENHFRSISFYPRVSNNRTDVQHLF